MEGQEFEVEETEFIEEVGGTETETEETTEETANDEYVKGESANETAERLLKTEQKDELPGHEATETPPQAPDNARVVKKGKAQRSRAENGQFTQEPEPQVPQRFNAYEKSVYEKAPPAIKKAISRMVSDHEGFLTKKSQEIAQYERGLKGINEAVAPYVAEWGQRGLTVPQALAEFGAVQRMLTQEDTKRDTALRLLQNISVSPEELIELRDGGGGQQPQQRGPSPEVAQLQGQLGQLQSYLEQQDAQRRVAPIVAELDSVRQERDSAGNFMYPELFDPAFIERVKPLVLARLSAHPGLSLSDALKLTHYEITGRQAGSANGNQTRLPANSNSTTQKATQAAVSVRGKSAPVTNGAELDAPPEALKDPRATMDWVMRNFR